MEKKLNKSRTTRQANKMTKYKYKIVILNVNDNLSQELCNYGKAGYHVIWIIDIDRDKREYTLEKEYK